MLSKIKTIALEGLNGYLVDIQCDVSGGLPNFEIVGLPDIRVKEAKERVRIAIKNSKMEFPSRKIIVNLAPADKRKEGTFFDLPIAISILDAIMGINSKINLSETIFLGELSLDGEINKVNGVLPMCIEARKLNIKNVILPIDNLNEAEIVDNINIIPVNNLNEVIDILKKGETMKNEYIIKEKSEKNKTSEMKYNVDFSDVKGQEIAKRALEIAAAGRA